MTPCGKWQETLWEVVRDLVWKDSLDAPGNKSGANKLKNDFISDKMALKEREKRKRRKAGRKEGRKKRRKEGRREGRKE